MNDNAQVNTDKMAAIARYLSFGWALVPLHRIRPDGRCSCDRNCGTSAGKHPVDTAWQHNPYRDEGPWLGNIGHPWNVGIATGAPSGHWVLDYDPAHITEPGAELVVRLRHEGFAPHVRTGGGGEHWRFRMPADFEVTNRRGSLPVGLDVRGTGGQVVAPPSVSAKGPYVELADLPPYDAPGWLLDMIRPAKPLPRELPPAGWSRDPGESQDDRGQRYAAGAVRELLGELANAPEGTRNDTAFRVAARLIELGNAGWIGDWTAEEWCRAGESTGLEFTELDHVWGSALRHVGDRPAELPPEWTDPLRVEVWPAPPTSPVGVPPFSSGFASGMASTPTQPGMPGDGAITFVDPSISAANGNGVDPTVVAWEAAVAKEVNRELVREAAKERLRVLREGDRASAVQRLRGELLTAEQLKARPRLRPLVAGLLYRNTLARINGASGSGKSFLVLDLAARVAAGLPWCGRAIEPGPVVYLVAEGDEGVGRRLDAWEARHGRPVDGVLFMPRPVQTAGTEWSAWCEVLAELRPALVVVDTQARVSVGADENDARAMGELVHALDGLRTATGACVLLVHHTGRTGTHGRGSTAVTGALQTELAVSRAGREITLKTGKAKDDAEGDDAIFDLTDVPADGPFVDPGAVLGVVPVWRGDAVRAERSIESARTTRARQLWTAIHDRYNPGMGGTYAEVRQAWADVAWSGRPTVGAAGNAYRKAWARAWADLIQRGLIAKAVGAGRFKVVELADQSADGVLTSNINKDGELISEGPTGFEVILTDITESDKGA